MANGVTSSQFWDRVWLIITRGPLVYVTGTIVVTAVLLATVVAFIDNTSKLRFTIKRLLSEQTATLSKEELEACNEWIAVVETGDSYEQARSRADRFKQAYDQSGHKVWSNNILVVRELTDSSRWLVVVDTWPGRSDQRNVASGIKEMQVYVKGQRDREDTLGMWLVDAHPIDYRLDLFAKTYGRITDASACPTKVE
jgi:hypothetical protein